MAHSTESSSVFPSKTIDRRQRAYSGCGATNPIVDWAMWCYGTEQGHTYYRDASHHTPLDSYGWRNPQPYLFQRHRFPYSGGDARYLSTNCNGYWWDNPCGNLLPNWYWSPQHQSFPPGGIILNAARIELRNKLLAKANRTEFDLGVALGEGRETYRMVLDAINGITKVFRDIRRGRFGAVARRLLDIRPTDAWLQYRYGWSPAINDVYNAVSLWDKYVAGDYRKLRFHVKSKADRPFNMSHWDQSYTSGPPFASITNGKWRMKGRFDYRVDDLDYVTMAAAGVHNPALVAWELLTLSFVVDWFISVGDFLEAWAREGALKYLGGSQSYIFEGTEVGRWVDGNGYRVDKDQPMEHHMFVFQRWVEIDPQPGLTVDPDTLLGLWSNVRIADAAALLYNTVIGGNTRYRRR